MHFPSQASQKTTLLDVYVPGIVHLDALKSGLHENENIGSLG